MADRLPDIDVRGNLQKEKQLAKLFPSQFGICVEFLITFEKNEVTKKTETLRH